MPSTLIIVPGACCPPHLYNTFTSSFPSHYDIRTLTTLTVREKLNNDPPTDTPPSMYDDAKHIAATVLKIISEEGKDVVLMPHSYGGTPTTEALEIIKQAGGFKVDRQEEGKKGGLKGVGYMTCLLPEVGGGAGSVQPDPNPHAIPFDVTPLGWLAHIDYPIVASICCNLLPPSTGTSFVQNFGYHSARSFSDPLTSMTVQGLALSWLLCEKDLCILPEVQQGGVDRLNKALMQQGGVDRLTKALGEGQEVKVTRVAADHVPNESMVEETRGWVIGLMEA